jgi:methionyl-tRNA formyltransferase
MLKLAFASSSSFAIPILESLLDAENKTLLDIFFEQTDNLNHTLDKLDFTISSDFLDNVISLKSYLEAEIPEIFLEKISTPMLITQPSTLVGKKSLLNPVHAFALKNNLQIFTPEKINNALDEFLNIDLDLVVVASYGQILSQKVLEATRFGMVNWHPSLLPKYRGATPMQSSLINGDETTGLSWIEMNAGMDSGNLVLQVTMSQGRDMTFEEVSDKMSELGSRTWAIVAVNQIWNRLHQKQALFKAQDKNISFTKIFKKTDRLISPNLISATQIWNRWRGLKIFPGVSYESRYFKQEVKLLKCLNPSTIQPDLTKQNINFENDEFLKIKNQVWLKCANSSYLPVLEIQTMSSGGKLNLSGYRF